MAFLNSGLPQSSAPTYGSVLSQMTSTGWTVVTEGESGAQLKKAKEMRTADKVCIGVGVPMIFLWGFGFVLILIGVLDYAFFTKEQTYFLSRTEPSLPLPTIQKRGGFRII